MIKEIPFAGYTAQPSDYTAPDGTLAHSLNLLNEDGAIRPLFPPTTLFKLPPNLSVVYIHKSNSIENYIILDGEGCNLYWISSTDTAKSETIDINQLHPMLNFSDMDIFIISFASTGNVLNIALSDGMLYYLWDIESSNYIQLGNHLPEIDIEFALMRDTSLDSNQYFQITAEDPDGKFATVIDYWLNGSGERGTIPPHRNDPTYQEVISFVSNSVIGGLNKYLAESSANNNFTQPFFVRYAFRLFDGSHAMLSAPVLMIPNSGKPLIKARSLASVDGVLSIKNEIIFPPAKLMLRILKGADQLKKWKSIITHIDIFVSPQIYTFDQNQDLTFAHRVTEDRKNFTHMGTATAISTETRSEVNHHRPAAGSITNKSNYILGENIEQVKEQTGANWWTLKAKSRKDLESDIKDSNLFYKIAELDVDDVYDMETFVKAEKDGGDSLTTLVNHKRLEDEIYTHHTLSPNYMHPYNARLNLSGVSLIPFSGFPIRSQCQYTFQGKDESNFEPITLYVHIKNSSNDQWIALKTPTTTDPLSPYCYDSIKKQFPRWLFYPDTSATEMILALNDGYYRIILTAHDFLNGSFWFRGLTEEVPEFIEGNVPESIISSANENKKIPLLNRLFTSEINNPFLFPVTGITTIGTGEIRGISSAARALSQGQFGQFPLYAFSTEGIWALEVNPNTGGFTARQPISRDVVLNPESITQIDSAVLFATDRGIMHIAGSQVECISETIDSDFPFQPATLPHLLRLSTVLSEIARSLNTSNPQQTILPFKDFIHACRMAYDYINQRIYIYSTSRPYAYVYSLKSRSWGFIASSFTGSLNSYPEAYAIASDPDGNRIVDLSRPDTEAPCPALLLTRPLKLDGPDILKTVDTVITRGDFRRGHVRSILYGSRDLRTWHPVWSSVDHSLRGFRGSPYKYFRLALLCDLQPDESISSASFQFSPRYTNSLR